jgi:phosphatidylglycerophosphate synthase
MRTPVVVLGHLLLSSALLVAWSGSFYCASRALNFATPLVDVWRAAIPSVLAASIPGFVNGWGAREGAAALAYGWAGLSSTEGSAVSVTYGLVGMLLAGLGLGLLLPRWATEKNELTNWSRNHAIIVLAAVGVSLVFGSPWVIGFALLLSFAHLVYDHRGVHTPLGTFGWANGVTAARLGLVLLLVTGAVGGSSPIVIVCASVLALDAIDGWVARKTGSSSAFGERFDMETDAAFVLAMSWLLAVDRNLGAWALIPGLWRYAYVLWEAASPPRYGPAGRANFARYSFLFSVLLQIAALGSPDWLARPFAGLAAALVSASFLLAAYYCRFGGRHAFIPSEPPPSGGLRQRGKKVVEPMQDDAGPNGPTSKEQHSQH